MNNKIVGATLLAAAGFTAAFSTAAAQIANSIVLAIFQDSNRSGKGCPNWVHALCLLSRVREWRRI